MNMTMNIHHVSGIVLAKADEVRTPNGRSFWVRKIVITVDGKKVGLDLYADDSADLTVVTE